MICNKCGQQNEDNVFFCRFCGAMLKQPGTQGNGGTDLVNNVQTPVTETRQSFVQETVIAENTAVNFAPQGEKPVYGATTVPTYESQPPVSPVQQPTQSYGAPVQPMRPQGIPYLGGVPAKSSSDGIGMAIAALACGISAIVIPYIGLIVGILAIIFGCVAKHKGNTSPMATAGIVCGAVGIVVGLLWLVVCAVIIEEATGIIYNSYPYYY
ncbi:MAG: hypothetical protein IJN96_01475 [Clostridia bacterium]|nr:hypothetical protein [Clostridia bacterium]